MHPGLILPPRFQSTQGLFRQAGMAPMSTPANLQRLAGTIPPSSPRFMSHDCTAMSTSVYSNFRKSAINFIECTDKIQSESRHRYQNPAEMGLAARGPKYRFGSPNEIYGGSEL